PRRCAPRRRGRCTAGRASLRNRARHVVRRQSSFGRPRSSGVVARSRAARPRAQRCERARAARPVPRRTCRNRDTSYLAHHAVRGRAPRAPRSRHRAGGIMSINFTASLREADPTVASLVDAELTRRRDGLELIASENFASRAVIDAMGTPLTNKYAEGYPGKRYYGGCEVVDQVEQLAIDRCRKLFGAEHANVQPHSGATANFSAFLALMKPDERFLAMAL